VEFKDDRHERFELPIVHISSTLYVNTNKALADIHIF